jgi:hypothetical protein
MEAPHMKPWKPLLALFGLTLAASVSTAAVQFQGLQYAPTGSSVVDVGADKRLTVSNIGSSGQDGVSVSCLHMDGMRLSLDGSCSSADAGASVALTYRATVSGTALTPRLRLACAVGASFVDVHVALNEFSSSSTQTVTLSRSGSVVYSAVVPAGTVARVMMDATGSCPNPELACSVARDPQSGLATGKRSHASASFSSSVHVSVAGHDDDCDDIDFSSVVDTEDEDCDGDSSDLRVSCPQGSSFSTVRCSSGECRVFDQFVSGSGLATVVASPPGGSSRPPLFVSNLGSSGQDGVEIKDPRKKGSARACVFSPPSLSIDSATDNGASIRMTISGSAFSSSGVASPAFASLALTVTGSSFRVACDHSSLGADAESVAVLSNGVEVFRCALPPGASVQVSAPPGAPSACAIQSLGKHTKGYHVSLLKAPMFGAGQVTGPDAASPSNVDDGSCALQVSFRSVRDCTCGTQAPVAGDQLVFWGGGTCSSGACASSFEASSTQLRVACPNPASSLSSLSLLDFASADGDRVFADVAGTTALSSAHTCVSVPFSFSRVDQTPVRAYSVRFHVSPELARCGTSVVEGDYLSRVAGTQMFVTDNGGGSFTVDCGTLGGVCGATGSGTLFSVDFSAAQPLASSVGAVTVDAVTVRDCSNQPVVADAGGSSFIPLQFSAPAPVSSLSATTQKTGNPSSVAGIAGGAVAGIVVGAVLAPTTPASSVSVEFYAKPFGNYPLFDKGTSPGAAPSPPSSSAAALAADWRRCTCTDGLCSSTSLVDLPPSRDLFHYVAFVRDLYGNESPVSSMASALDYHLGDVSDGLLVCSGDNLVSMLDISALGAHYGASVPASSWFACLDVGPTTDFSVSTRPTVDGRIDFEDFMMFAMNFGVVSAPSASLRPLAAAMNASQLVVPALPAVGQTFDAGVVVDGAGDVQGVSIQLAYDHDVLEQVGVAAGSLLGQQGRASSVLSSGPGNLDAALLGGGPGIAGHGEIATVTFRVKSAGDPKLSIASLNARGGDNQPVAIAGAVGGTTVPAHSALGFAYPNPFRESLAFQLSLHASGPASIGIYDIAGRRVRALVQGVQPAGSRIVTWDGRDDSGLRLAPGAYILRLDTAGVRESRTVRLVR